MSTRVLPSKADIPSADLHIGARGDLDVFIRIATSEEDFRLASDLVNEMYATRSYPSNIIEPKPMSFTFLAFDGIELVGTVTLGLDSIRVGLLADQLYKTEVDLLRKRGRRVVEFTKLAISRATRMSVERSQIIFGSLLHAAHIVARRIYDFTDVVLEVIPLHRDFYIKMLDCRPLGAERLNQRVKANVVLLTLDLSHVDHMICVHGGLRRAANKKTMYSYFFCSQQEAAMVHRLRTQARLIDAVAA